MNYRTYRVRYNQEISLPGEILDVLQIEDGDAVFVELNRAWRQIVISPVPIVAAKVNAEFSKQLTAFIEEYRPALEALTR